MIKATNILKLLATATLALSSLQGCTAQVTPLEQGTPGGPLTMPALCCFKSPSGRTPQVCVSQVTVGPQGGGSVSSPEYTGGPVPPIVLTGTDEVHANIIIDSYCESNGMVAMPPYSN